MALKILSCNYKIIITFPFLWNQSPDQNQFNWYSFLSCSILNNFDIFKKFFQIYLQFFKSRSFTGRTLWGFQKLLKTAFEDGILILLSAFKIF